MAQFQYITKEGKPAVFEAPDQQSALRMLPTFTSRDPSSGIQLLGGLSSSAPTQPSPSIAPTPQPANTSGASPAPMAGGVAPQQPAPQASSPFALAQVMNALEGKVQSNNALMSQRNLLLKQLYNRPLDKKELEQLDPQLREVIESGDRNMIDMNLRLIGDQIEGRTNSLDQSVQFLTNAYQQEQERIEKQRNDAIGTVLDFVQTYGPNAPQALKALYGQSYLDTLKAQGIDIDSFAEAAIEGLVDEDTQVVDVGGNKVLINSRTGETIKTLGSTGSGGEEDKWLTVEEAIKLGVPYGTTRAEATGLIPKKPLGETQTTDLIQAQIAKNNVSRIAELIQDLGQQGPVIGSFRASNPYDTRIVELNNLITQTVPGLARGIFKEVGVLTDQDINRYMQTLANPKLTKEQADNATKQLMKTIDYSIKTQLTTFDKAGKDTREFEDLLQSVGGGGKPEQELQDDIRALSGQMTREQLIDKAVSAYPEFTKKQIQDAVYQMLPDDWEKRGIQPLKMSFSSGGAGTNRPQRNNNPGNLKTGGLADKFAVGTDDQGHLIFPDVATGQKALALDLQAKISGNSQHVSANPTIAQLGKVYAEDPTWSQKVATKLGVPASTKAGQVDFTKLLQAIMSQEGFYA